ncbi:hypothetical protein [Citrobacter braakii]|jgi:hypothetical protein|uniref:hypothetical protein n=1 Tax=Citrobacter braakii TaxID=57706 RepID=UPI00242A7D78|nr:hypothetical protein [Citrobacter braakii]MEB0965650.1 hypothetical protein [Citrobacter braakii]WFX93718.1 hypothetical protein NFK19_15295 [Citrobacter braakii]WFY02760.1 hypothetical protein NFK21_15290 [Citrobacter braakii]
MDTAKIFKLSDSHTALSNVFIRIKDKRTPCGNYFFRLDKLDCVSVVNNSGLTPLLEVTGGYIDPSVTYEQFMNFLFQVFDDVSKGDNSIKVYELMVDEETVRDVPPRTWRALHASKNATAENSPLKDDVDKKHLSRLYYNGTHAGNVKFEIELWGMNSPVREAEIKRRLDGFISGLQVDWRGL